MEDESYRNFVLSKLNKTLDKKIAPDDHIDDVVSTTCFQWNDFIVTGKKIALVRPKTSVERNAENVIGCYSRFRTNLS